MNFHGGQGGIRTHGTLAGSPHFECGAIDHSTTCPLAVIKKAAPQGKPFLGLAKIALQAQIWSRSGEIASVMAPSAMADMNARPDADRGDIHPCADAAMLVAAHAISLSMLNGG